MKDFDKNLIAQRPTAEGIEYYDIRETNADMYGVFFDEENGKYARLTKLFAKSVSDGVAILSEHTAGGRIRFKTNSRVLRIKTEWDELVRFVHFPLTGSCALSLYADYNDGTSKFIHCFIPPLNPENGYEAEYKIPDYIKADGYTLYMPLYNSLNKLWIGVSQGEKIESGLKYKRKEKVLFYGSSVTQGGCASTAGNDYQSHLSRWFNFDFINLGFSGNAKGEENMAQYIASLHPDVFVMDYDYNAPTVEHLQQTHKPFFEIFRKTNPYVPVIFMSRSSFDIDLIESPIRRDIIKSTYIWAKEQGDENVYFIDGENIFGEDGDACTMDSCHPNDLGFYRTAQALRPVLQEIFEKENNK
jgi:hypothetical protein